VATVTPNFNWPVPTSGDLVKNGATAIESLGDSIDASMAELKGGTTGQVLSKTSNTDMDFTWVAQDDSNAIQNSIVDAKGDLIGATAADTPARLAVGTNGQVLTADSTAATGLAWATVSVPTSLGYSAGKNQCINGAFNVWQRGTSFGANVYTADRWATQTDKTVTVSQQTFTPGIAPVAGYEGTFFLRQTYTASGNYAALQTKLEDVRLFAGQTITLSYWAKADATFSNTPSISQNFGSGGSGGVGTNGTTHNITTTWTRYSSTITVPSISGKTIGTSSFFMLQPILLESTGARTIDIWGVQVEAGSTATAFQTASGSVGGELALCQRYYWRTTSGTTYGYLGGDGYVYTSTNFQAKAQFPVTMRIAPTSIDFGNVAMQDASAAIFAVSAITNDTTVTTTTGAGFAATISGGTTLRYGRILSNNNSAGYLGFSAEL
jgi:hypothetical protein